MEDTLDKLQKYYEWMSEELEDTDVSVQGWSEYVNTMVGSIASIQAVLDILGTRISAATREKWEKELQKLKEQDEEINKNTKKRDDELEYQV